MNPSKDSFSRRSFAVRKQSNAGCSRIWVYSQISFVNLIHAFPGVADLCNLCLNIMTNI
jgi:hypothetical protein